MIEGLSDNEIEQRLLAAPDKRWQDLWDVLNASALQPEKGQWTGGEMAETIVVDGMEKSVIQMPYVIYSASVFDVIAKVGGLGASQPFDWQAWDGLNRYPKGRGLGEAPVAESIRVICGGNRPPASRSPAEHAASAATLVEPSVAVGV